jgi:hypothetical protein
MAIHGRDSECIVVFVMWALNVIGFSTICLEQPMPHEGNILCNDFGTWFQGIEHARNSVICENIRLQLAINMMCSRYS